MKIYAAMHTRLRHIGHSKYPLPRVRLARLLVGLLQSETWHPAHILWPHGSSGMLVSGSKQIGHSLSRSSLAAMLPCFVRMCLLRLLACVNAFRHVLHAWSSLHSWTALSATLSEPGRARFVPRPEDRVDVDISRGLEGG